MNKKKTTKKALNGTKLASPELIELNPDAQSSMTLSMNYNQNLAQQTAGTNQINPVDQANAEAIMIDPNQANAPVSPDMIGPENTVTPAKERTQFRNPFEGGGTHSGEFIAGGIGLLNALIPSQNNVDMRQYVPNIYNPNAFGTGSTAIMKNGGPITDTERMNWENMQTGAFQQRVNNINPEFMQSYGVDPTRINDYKQDFINLQQTNPFRVGIKNERPQDSSWGQGTLPDERYRKFQYDLERYNPQTKGYETYASTNTGVKPFSKQEFNEWANTQQPNYNTQPQQMQQNTVAQVQPIKSVKEAGLLSKEEAIAAKKARGGNKESFYMKDGGKVKQQASTQDSLDIYNNAKKVEAYYNSKNYKLKESTKSNNKYFKNILDADNNEFLDKNSKGMISYPGADGKYHMGTIPKENYRKIVDKNKVYQRESANSILDTRSPMPLYDSRINPQYKKTYENINSSDPLFMDNVELNMYDPIAVKPYNMLTPQEKIIRDSKYGGAPVTMQPKINPESISNSPIQTQQQIIQEPLQQTQQVQQEPIIENQVNYVPAVSNPEYKVRYNKLTNNADFYDPQGHIEDTKRYSYDNGGMMGDQDIRLTDEGSIKPISANMYSNPIMQFTGDSHEKGGIPLEFGGQKAEVEGDETAYKDLQGNLQIFGNMKVPGTNKKFKSLSKDIAKKEIKASKIGARSTDIIDNASPFDAYSATKFNTGMVLQDAAKQRHALATEEKEGLAMLQNSILETAEQFNMKPDKVARMMKDGGEIPKFKDGGEINEIRKYAADAAQKYGVDPDIIYRLINTESGYNSKAVSNKGATGIMQFMPATAKQYGVTPAELKSSDPKVQAKVVDAGVKHFSGLLKKNNNDYKLALAAYNGGQGSVDFVKKELGKEQISGDDWVNFMSNRRETSPTKKDSAWQNQTFNYVNTIAGGANKVKQEAFRKYYYEDNPYAYNETQPLPLIISPLPVDRTFEPYTPNTKSAPEISTPPPATIENPTPKPPVPQRPSLADNNGLGITDFMSELAYLGARPGDVPFRRVEPVLHTPYQVSFQDRLNENQAGFRSLERQLPNNAEALSILAGQKYQADNAVLADQFRTNQGIANDVTNKNVGILNQNAMVNYQIGDTHDVRQAQAEANTQAQKYQALASFSNKFGENRQENNNIRLAESLSNYRLNDGQVQNYNPEAQFNFNNTTPISQDTKDTYVYDNSGNLVQVKKVDQTETQKALEAEKLRKAKQITTNKWGGKLNKKC